MVPLIFGNFYILIRPEWHSLLYPQPQTLPNLLFYHCYDYSDILQSYNYCCSYTVLLVFIVIISTVILYSY